MGFKSDNERTCIACDSDSQHGINPETGVCVTCSQKHTFSTNAKDTGYCREKTVLIPSAMQYGLTSTRDYELEKQCWYILYKDGFDKYKECILK